MTHPEAGRKQGKLTFTGNIKHERKTTNYQTWLYEVTCVCGYKFFVSRANWYRPTQSCLKCRPKHITQPLRETRLYNIWCCMKARCYNEKHPRYKHYGGRGRVIYDEWHDFKVFASWAFQAGYNDKLTIDRIDYLKGYEPTNCRWIPRDKNLARRRYVHTYPHGECFLDAVEAAKFFSVVPSYIRSLCNGGNTNSCANRWFYYGDVHGAI